MNARIAMQKKINPHTFPRGIGPRGKDSSDAHSSPFTPTPKFGVGARSRGVFWEGMGIKYARLKKLDRGAHRDIRSLVRQLVGSTEKHRYSPTVMARAVRDSNTFILTARHGASIVGMGTLIMIFTPSGLSGMMEDVVVHENARGMGVGRAIMERLIAEARRKKIMMLELTSNPSRIAANRLYQSLGFQKRETNPYRLILS